MVMAAFTSPPIRTGCGSEQSITSAGLVARDRSVASARKLTLATLPTSPSCSGISSISTRASPPGGRTPSVQTRSPSRAAGSAAGLAGGVVAISDVPRGTESRRVTSWAVALPTLRTSTS